MHNTIYLDNAATTGMDKECAEILTKYGCESFYNPSALYGKAAEVKIAVNDARCAIASAMGANADEIIFTSSGTESDNTAVFGSIKAKKGKILINAAEHSAVYNPATELKNRGFDVVFVPVNGFGAMNEEDFEKELTPDVIFASVMHVNNETGAVNDIRKLCSLAKSVSPKIVFHSDGVQALGKLKLNVNALGIDLYSVSAHKIGGPKGVGALYKRRGFNLKPLIFGGGQEFGLRSATENVGGICAFAKACEISKRNTKDFVARSEDLKRYAIHRLTKFEGIRINTDTENSAPHIVNFAMNSVRGEVMLHSLEKHGILVGTGSACSSNKGGARIPKALGLKDGYEQGVLRLSFGKDTDTQSVDRFFDAFIEEYENLKNYVRI